MGMEDTNRSLETNRRDLFLMFPMFFQGFELNFLLLKIFRFPDILNQHKKIMQMDLDSLEVQ